MRLKHLCSSFSNSLTQSSLTEEGTYKVYGAGGFVGYLDEYGSEKPYLGIVKDGAGVGRVQKYDAYTSLLGTLAYIIPNDNADIDWLKYVILSLDLGKDVGKTTIPHIYFSEYGNRGIAYVNIDYQRCIANYLDKECAYIDSVIDKTRASIEEYKKLKQAVITRAVTKGIRPDRPMKDSGIEWIGEIPAEWEVRKLFRAIKQIGDIDHYMPESVEDGIPYLMTGDLSTQISQVDFSACKKISFENYEKLSAKIKPENDDVIFARYATIGTVCYVDVSTDFLVSYSCLTIKPVREILNGKFLFYYLKSQAFFEDIQQYVKSNTQSNVGLDSMSKAKVLLPTVSEQQNIVTYLDEKCVEIDALISKKEQLLSEFEKYKKSLIFEYVTGKKSYLNR